MVGNLRKVAENLVKRFPYLASAYELNRRLRQGNLPVYLDYSVKPQARYGWGKAAHPLLYSTINANRMRYAEVIDEFTAFAERLAAIPVDEPSDPNTPYWENGYVMGLDPVSLYAFPKLFNSRLYLEIGSGNSTKFVRRSIQDNNLQMEVVSIDPYPRAEIDSLCDEIVRRPLEELNLDVVDKLGDGDILMVDNSHRCFQNSDVAVMFMEVLPRLGRGVLIYIDDIYLPYDYPPEWAQRYYSEQYLLGVLLMADLGRRYEIVFPTFFVCFDEELRRQAEGFWNRMNLGRSLLDGNGFWLRVKS
jgi:hypothetical protein